jgi:hypothetical protein
MQTLFGDAILLEFLKEEWDKEQKASPIVIPSTVQEKDKGKYFEKEIWHFFRVLAIGPECHKVQVGDRLIPKPPSMQCNPTPYPIIMWINGKRETRYIVQEQNIAGVEGSRS